MSDFVSGWCGGVCFLSVCHPFDTIKVRTQVSLHEGMTPLSSYQCARRMWEKEGLYSFYRGVAAPMMGFGISRAAQFGVYGKAIEYFEKRKEEEIRQERQRRLEIARELERRRREQSTLANLSYKIGKALGVHEESLETFVFDHDDLAGKMQNQAHLPAWLNGACAALGGLTFSFINTPFEVVRVRMQTEPLYEHREYRNTFDCVKQLWRCGGVSKIYLGLGVTLCRDIPATVIYFGSYGVLRSLLPQDESRISITSSILAGGIAGALQWAAIIPLDAIKTRVQTARLGEYKGAVVTAGDMMKTHGFRGFYRGLTPALARACFSNAALFAGVESSMMVMQAFSSRSSSCPVSQQVSAAVSRGEEKK